MYANGLWPVDGVYAARISEKHVCDRPGPDLGDGEVAGDADNIGELRDSDCEKIR